MCKFLKHTHSWGEACMNTKLKHQDKGVTSQRRKGFSQLLVLIEATQAKQVSMPQSFRHYFVACYVADNLRMSVAC